MGGAALGDGHSFFAVAFEGRRLGEVVVGKVVGRAVFLYSIQRVEERLFEEGGVGGEAQGIGRVNRSCARAGAGTGKLQPVDLRRHDPVLDALLLSHLVLELALEGALRVARHGEAARR